MGFLECRERQRKIIIVLNFALPGSEVFESRQGVEIFTTT